MGARLWRVRGGEQIMPVVPAVRNLGEAQWSWSFVETAETANTGQFVLLLDEERMWMFDADRETVTVKRVPKRSSSATLVLPYELPWPPTFDACL